LANNEKLLTSQFVVLQPDARQISKLEDPIRNPTYTKPSQNSVTKGVACWCDHLSEKRRMVANKQTLTSELVVVETEPF
jgi:hypothetical protein